MHSSLQLRVLQLGVVFGVILYLVNFIAADTMNTLYAAADMDIWIDISPLWVLLSYFVTGLLFALGYANFYNGIPGRGLHKGLQYGFWIWMVGATPVFFLILTNILVPAEVVIAWIIMGFFVNIIFGLLCGWLYRPHKK